MPLIWEKTPEQVFVPGIEGYIQAINEGVYQLMLYYSPQVEAWMKSEAKWVDRTGNARQSLHTQVEQELYQIILTMAYGAAIDYSIFLEFAHASRYSVLAPALDYWTPILWAAVKRLLS